MRNVKLRRAAKAGFLAGAAVFLCGFFTLNILYAIWQRQNPGSTLRGLYSYRAAAIGDPICLPMLVGALTARANLTARKPEKWQRLCSITAGVLGGAVGALIQALWLLRDDMELNWSIPALHRFNFAGWEHALFFVLVIATVIFLLFRRALFPEEKAPRRVLLLLDLFADFAACFFMQLHAHDEYLKLGEHAAVLTATAVCTLLILMLLQGIRMLLARTWNTTVTNCSAWEWLPILMASGSALLLSLFI